MKCSVSLPVRHNERCETVKCVRVAVHLASVRPRVILGYPFLARYGLTLSPARGFLVFDDVQHGEHIPDELSADVEDQHLGVEPEVQNLVDQDQLANSSPISEVQGQDQLTESSPIFQVYEVSNTPHLQSQDLDINSDDADQSVPHPTREPTPDEVMLTPEPCTRGGEEKAWDYYVDIAAVQDYSEEDHAKTEDGDHPSSDGSSDEGWLGFDPPLGFMDNFGYSCDSEGCMKMSVDYVGPDQLNRQRHVPQEHSPDVEVDTRDESKDVPGDSVIWSPVFDPGGKTDVKGNQAHIVFRKPAGRAKGRVLRSRNLKGGSRYVRSTGESCILTPGWYEIVCDWAGEEFRPELNPLPKFQGDHASKTNPWSTSGRRKQKKSMRMLTCDQNGRPMGFLVPWSDHKFFLHPKESETAVIVKKCRWDGGGV